MIKKRTVVQLKTVDKLLFISCKKKLKTIEIKRHTFQPQDEQDKWSRSNKKIKVR